MWWWFLFGNDDDASSRSLLLGIYSRVVPPKRALKQQQQLYCPGKDELDQSWIPVDNNSIFAGDFNGHSQIGDHIQPTDDRGEKIVDWVIQHELQCVNDRSTTRINRAIGGLSTPDITFVTRGLQTKTKWTTVKDTSMGSDYQPIIIELHKQDIQTISTTPMRSRWKSKEVDWEAFRQEVESAFP